MSKLDIRVDYNVILFNFVNSLSLWSEFVSDHVFRYFEKNYGITEEDKRLLQKYSKLRTVLSWDKSDELYEWAYSAFERNETFSELLPIIKHFENKTNKEGRSLRGELRDVDTKLVVIKPIIESKFEAFQTETMFQKFTDLFESKELTSTLPCYLLYSPDKDNTSGGANGERIVVEISTELPIEKQVKITLETITHEYLHKRLQPGRLFISLKDTKGIAKNYPAEFSNFIEEVIIHSICEVITFGNSVSNNLEYYQEEKNLQMIEIWNGIKRTVPVLVEYTNNQLSIEDTRKALVNLYS